MSLSGTGRHAPPGFMIACKEHCKEGNDLLLTPLRGTQACIGGRLEEGGGSRLLAPMYRPFSGSMDRLALHVT